MKTLRRFGYKRQKTKQSRTRGETKSRAAMREEKMAGPPLLFLLLYLRFIYCKASFACASCSIVTAHPLFCFSSIIPYIITIDTRVVQGTHRQTRTCITNEIPLYLLLPLNPSSSHVSPSSSFFLLPNCTYIHTNKVSGYPGISLSVWHFSFPFPFLSFFDK